MGAMLRFKRETGREVTEIDGVTDLCTYLWCCVYSAAKADGLTFGLSLMDFADAIDLADIVAWSEHINAGAAEEADDQDGEKKSL